MRAPQDGGPAFPVPLLPGDVWNDAEGNPNGMSLRDWFASQASDADIDSMRNKHSKPVPNTDRNDGFGPDYIFPTRQEARYLHADAMLAARERKEDA